MKLIALIVLCLTGTAFAAAPVIEVRHIHDISVDGKASGSVLDVLLANPSLRDALYNALGAYDNARDAVVIAAQTKASADVAAAQAKQAAAETARASLVAAVEAADPATLPAQAKAALQAAKLTSAQKEKADLQAQKAAIEARISALP